jgi:hypothetical protein
MKKSTVFPTREEAGRLLDWAYEQNPGPWAEHCRVVARAAETIALKCGLHGERAYVSGLLHDIGYYEYRNGKGRTCHIYSGYDFMIGKGYEAVARICLSHSFPYQDIKAYGGSDMNCSDGELNNINAFLLNVAYNEYDKLIQLCDCLGAAQGICLLEQRMISVAMRHGFGDFTIHRWKAFFELKDFFDTLCGMNIYNLFANELMESIFPA